MATTARALATALSVAAVAASFGACGGTSRPAYCQDRTDLQDSIKGLADVDVASGGASAVKAQLQKVESDAKALASSARSDFPSETTAIDTALTRLKTSVTQLSASPSAQQAAAVGLSVQGFANAVNDFVKASDSKC
ncbi:MAG: hypothetical protein LT070_13365 [Solirubrobacteraceae bacterium]|nr:hypothetical protein [Solirubrobacteraceae bacterium]